MEDFFEKDHEGEEPENDRIDNGEEDEGLEEGEENDNGFDGDGLED